MERGSQLGGLEAALQLVSEGGGSGGPRRYAPARHLPLHALVHGLRAVRLRVHRRGGAVLFFFFLPPRVAGGRGPQHLVMVVVVMTVRPHVTHGRPGQALRAADLVVIQAVLLRPACPLGLRPLAVITSHML